MATFGMEEEYVFLDPVTLEPRSVANEVYRRLGITRAESPQVQREFYVCQLERTTPPRLSGAGPVTNKERYHSVSNNYRGLVSQHFLNGLHIHVRIPDREAGVRALNRVRRWMPVIVALGGNSPFWDNGDTGFSSWRTINLQRWTTHGCPPVFADAADYERRTTALLGIGGHRDRALLAWNVRLSESHPTLEVRAPDSQLETGQSVMLAAIIRGLIETATERELASADPAPELLNASLGHAAHTSGPT